MSLSERRESFISGFGVGLIAGESEDISFMIQEHKFGRNYLNEIRCCIENCKMGNSFSVDMLADCLSTCSSIIKNHMDNEENYFFLLADKVLSEDVQEELIHKFDSIDKMYLGQDIYAEYQEKYKKLEKKYLGKINLVEVGNSNFFGFNF